MIKAFLSRARFKLIQSPLGRMWRGLFWKPAASGDGLRTVFFDRYAVFATNDSNNINDERARKVMREADSYWVYQHDKILALDKSVVIDPAYSLPFTEGRKIFSQIQGVHQEIVPSLSKYANARMFCNFINHDEVIHFDGFQGRNLWHFFYDAFNPLLMIDSTGLVSKDIPIIINRKVWETPIAQLLIKNSPLADRSWIVQDKAWIRANLVYKGFASYAWFKSAYEVISNVVDKGGARRIFLNRRARYGRNISNLVEVEAVTKAHGFETVYAEDLAFSEQVRMFAEASSVVAIHGAGLTNCLFSDASRLRCLEIQTESYLNPHYYWLLQMLGAERYDAIVGSALDRRQRFSVDAAVLDRQLGNLLDLGS